MRRHLTCFLVVLALSALASASALAGSAPDQKNFKLRGGKVQCVITSDVEGARGGVLCIGKLKSGVKPFPRPNCHGTGDPGGGLQLGATGRAKGLCLSEDPFTPPVTILRYGKSITLDRITCRAVSMSVGVRCRNASHHGFRMSPSGWARF